MLNLALSLLTAVFAATLRLMLTAGAALFAVVLHAGVALGEFIGDRWKGRL